MSKAIKFIKAIWDVIKPSVSRINVTFDLVRDDPCGIEMISILILTWTEQVAETAAMKLKLDAATEALRRIDCLTHDEPEEISKMVHVLANEGWRATQA